jgi:hypothetical protein
MQISWVEFGDPLQRVEVPDANLFPGQIDYSFRAETLQDSVDVNGSEPGCVGQFHLRHWKIEPAVFDQSNHRQTMMHFADLMRDAMIGVSPAEVNNPGTQDRLVKQRAPPKATG